jgi:hypothetical protein
MKKYINFLASAIMLMTVLNSCQKLYDKTDSLPAYANAGTASVLTASATSVAPAVTDSSNNVLTLNWTDPNYAVDSSTVKYVVQIDTSNNFLTANTQTLYGTRSVSFTGQALNNMLIAYGFPYGTAKSIFVKIISSYTNNNNLYNSNTLTIPATSYANPFNLAATSTGPFTPTVSNKDETATTLSWNVPTTATALTYVLQYDVAGNNFANAHEISLGTSVTSNSLTNLNVNSFAQQNGIANGAQGKIDVRIKAVSTANAAQIQYSTSVTLNITPQSMVLYLWAPGGYQGWDNSAAAPTLASTDGQNYNGFIWVPSGGNTSQGFKLTSDFSWSNSATYGDDGSNSGKLANPGGNLNWVPADPPTSTMYLVQANTAGMTYSITPITQWRVIGDFNGWSGDVVMTYIGNNKYQATVNFTGTGGFKFRANGAWDINLGGDQSQMTLGGDNLNSPAAGSHVVTLDLSTPPYFTYTVQ